MLHAFTLKAAGIIGSHWQASDWEIKAYAYSMQVIILATFQYSLYIGVAYAAGFLEPALIVIASSVGFRIFAGSWHLSTFPRCMFYSALNVLLAIAISLPPWPGEFRYSAALLTVVLVLTAIYRWIPAGIRKRVNTPHYRMVQKIKTLVFLLLSIVLITTLEYYHFFSYNQLLIASIGISAFHTTPGGRALIAFLNKLFDCLNKNSTIGPGMQQP